MVVHYEWDGRETAEPHVVMVEDVVGYRWALKKTCAFEGERIAVNRFVFKLILLNLRSEDIEDLQGIR